MRSVSERLASEAANGDNTTVNRSPLPIDAQLPEMLAQLREHGAIVVVAEPGAGKTTRLPPAIVKANLLSAEHPNLIMLQPRRIATRAAAERIAVENGWQVGREVGYQVRFENRTSRETRLRVVTEAILTRQLLEDPSLEGVGCVVLDEFHERSVHSDIALALLREVRNSLREDLKIVVMSATLDAEPVAKFLGDSPVVRVPGRTFPVEIVQQPRGGLDVEDALVGAIRKEIAAPGHLLAFLPGAAEIQRCQSALSSLASQHDADVLPLYGALPFEQQQRAVAPSTRRKIVLATNIAETSLTIDGIRTVIDSGLARVPRFDPVRGLDALTLERISQASATQRAGRAGRTAEGKCVRLWSAAEHLQMAAFDLPEIASIDLAGTLLDLHAFGETDVGAFAWFEKPPAESLAAGEDLLRELGAIDDAGRITPLGKRMAAMPVHPRLARLMLAAADAGEPRLGASVAAILSEKDFVRREWADRNAIGSNRQAADSDVEVRLHLLEEAERRGFFRDDRIDGVTAQQVAKVRDQLLRVTGERVEGRGERKKNVSDPLSAQPSSLSADLLLRLVLLAYPDRVCRRRQSDPRAGLMVGGVGVRLDQESAVIGGEFFVAVDPRRDDRQRAREAVVRIASRIEPEWLEVSFPQSIHIVHNSTYDADRGRLTSTKATKYLDLPLTEHSEPPRASVETAAALFDALRPTLEQLVEADTPLSPLVLRLRWLGKQAPDRGFFSLDDALWDELLREAVEGSLSRDQVQNKLASALRNRLAYPLDRLLDELAPEAVEVPTGSRVKLVYPSDPSQPPILAVRLQEMFGLPQTPRIAGGRVPVLLHLLGPNFRPVQVTQDLASFWKNTYPQVRKDLRARYPRQSWPEDPLTAPPIRGAKKRGT